MEWGLDKNVKGHEMENIVRIDLKRKAEGKESTFRLRGNPVDPKKICRYKKRKNVPESAVLTQQSPAAPTPSDISYDTPGSGDPPTPEPSGDVGSASCSPITLARRLMETLGTTEQMWEFEASLPTGS